MGCIQVWGEGGVVGLGVKIDKNKKLKPAYVFICLIKSKRALAYGFITKFKTFERI